MKKFISILLVGIMASSMAMFGVSAAEDSRFSTYTTERGVLVYVDSQTGHKYEFIADGVNSDGSKFKLVRDYTAVCDELFYKAIGNYMLFNPQTDGGFEGPLAIIKDDDVLGAYGAYKKKWIEDKAFFDAVQYSEQYKAYIRLIGDANNDGVLSVLDATKMQTLIVSKSSGRDGKFSDFNRDGKFNVSDATALQKYLVGLDYQE